MMVLHRARAPDTSDLFDANGVECPPVGGDIEIDWTEAEIAKIRNELMARSMVIMREEDDRVSVETMIDIYLWIKHAAVGNDVGNPFGFSACIAPYAAEFGLESDDAAEQVAKRYRDAIRKMPPDEVAEQIRSAIRRMVPGLNADQTRSVMSRMVFGSKQKHRITHVSVPLAAKTA